MMSCYWKNSLKPLMEADLNDESDILNQLRKEQIFL